MYNFSQMLAFNFRRKSMKPKKKIKKQTNKQNGQNNFIDACTQKKKRKRLYKRKKENQRTFLLIASETSGRVNCRLNFRNFGGPPTK